ncbi:MAG: TIGR04255 family protein [Planctomycetota bacterium]
MNDSAIKIDMSEKFLHLTHAPIVEAVIEIRARTQISWDQNAIAAWLKPRLPDYPIAHMQNEFHAEVTFEPQGITKQNHCNLGLKGVRFQSADKLHVAQFNRDGFVFSRLQPYENWRQLRSEAIRLWALHCELAKPADIQRLGLRFINRILVMAEKIQLEEYLRIPPQSPPNLNLPLTGASLNSV